MNIEPTPDLKIHNLILNELQNIPDLPLVLEELKPEYNETFGHKSWRYIFRYEDSPVRVKFSFSILKPGLYACLTTIYKSDHVYFSFNNYLNYIQNSDLKNFVTPSDPYKYAEGYLKILKHHLETGLKYTVCGAAWIDVPIDWALFGR